MKIPPLYFTDIVFYNFLFFFKSFIFLSEQQIEQLAPEADHAAHSAESAGKFIQFSLLCQATI